MKRASGQPMTSNPTDEFVVFMSMAVPSCKPNSDQWDCMKITWHSACVWLLRFQRDVLSSDQISEETAMLVLKSQLGQAEEACNQVMAKWVADGAVQKAKASAFGPPPTTGEA